MSNRIQSRKDKSVLLDIPGDGDTLTISSSYNDLYITIGPNDSDDFDIIEVLAMLGLPKEKIPRDSLMWTNLEPCYLEGTLDARSRKPVSKNKE